MIVNLLIILKNQIRLDWMETKVTSKALKTNAIFNQYFLLKIKIILLLFKKGKISIKNY